MAHRGDPQQCPLKKERSCMAKDERFEEVYTQGMMNVAKILRDRVTGVHYLFYGSGYAGGLTPLLEADGRPVVELREWDQYR